LFVIAVLLPSIYAEQSSFSIHQNNSEISISYEDTFLALDSPPGPLRNIAEFEPMQGVLIRYPLGISYQIIAELSNDVQVVTIVSSISQQNTVESLYINNGVDINNCSFLIAPSNTHWTRDYGPWFIFNGDDELAVVDFEYNRPRPLDNAIPSAFANDQGLPVYTMPLVQTGGNYMTDGQAISISTDLVWSENSGYTQSQINAIMNEYLGIQTYHVVADVNGEYIKHIDCWAKYLSPTTIMIREVPQGHSQYTAIEAAVSYFEGQNSCYGTPYEIARVYTPNNEPYTNSLIMNNKVLVPITGSSWDAAALSSYEDAMPGYEVIGFTGSWASTDALHCRTKGIPDQHMLYIQHTPLMGSQSSEEGYEIQAKIYPYSNQAIIPSATGVYWSVDSQNWDFITMQPVGNHYYQATIPTQANGTQISYYIQAEDGSGRIENHPYIGAAGAHIFTAHNEQGDNNPPETPQRPQGPASGKAGSTYRYSTSTNDPDEDVVFYLWDWGDETVSEWLGPYESGVEISTTHTWEEKGTYEIRVKAKDIYGEESDWSEPLAVSMPKNLIQSMPIVQKINQLFPAILQFIEMFLKKL
jgi:agmatine deiminase